MKYLECQQQPNSNHFTLIDTTSDSRGARVNNSLCLGLVILVQCDIMLVDRTVPVQLLSIRAMKLCFFMISLLVQRLSSKPLACLSYAIDRLHLQSRQWLQVVLVVVYRLGLVALYVAMGYTCSHVSGYRQACSHVSDYRLALVIILRAIGQHLYVAIVLVC